MILSVEEIKEAIINRKSNTRLEGTVFEDIKEKLQGLELEGDVQDVLGALLLDYERLGQELLDQVASKAGQSSLLKLNNRSQMLKVIQREWEGSKRYHSPTSLIIFSVDEIHEPDDQITSKQKEQLYRVLSEIIEKSTRLTDTFGRIDDEKFVIVVPTTNNIQAAWLSSKLRDSIASYDFGLSYKVSCSFGVADSGDSMDVEDWLAIAVDAYNRAVDLGGNTVIDYATIIEK